MELLKRYSPWILSGALHLSIATGMAWIVTNQDLQISGSEVVEFEVVDEPEPIPSPKAIEPKPQIKEQEVAIRDDPTPQEPAPDPVKPQEKVFGISDNAITSDGPGSISVKKGNTITKAPDDKVLEEGAEDLPIPEAEYLVSSMPELVSEVEIPYPKVAKSEDREGSVILKVLIDKEGRVRTAEILEKAGYGFDELAEEYIYQFKFKPAYIGEEPVAVEIRYAVNFELTQ